MEPITIVAGVIVVAVVTKIATSSKGSANHRDIERRSRREIDKLTDSYTKSVRATQKRK